MRHNIEQFPTRTAKSVSMTNPRSEFTPIPADCSPKRAILAPAVKVRGFYRVPWQAAALS